MDRQEIEFIAAAYSEYRRKLVSELSRFGGTDIDEIDEALVNELIKRLKRAGRLGKRIAHYDGTPWTGTPIWIDGAPNLLMWIRNQRFRPKLSEVTAEAERLGMIPESAIVEGGIADQRRQITAPAEYSVRALAASTPKGLLGMPEAPIPTEMPSWIEDFPSRGNADEDRIIVNCLLHMSEAKARETIERIVADRFAETRRHGEIEQQRAATARVRETRQAGNDGASVVMAEISRRRREAIHA